MATLFRAGSFRIVVYLNDHRPPLVHAVGEGHARFTLGGSRREVELAEQHGVSVSDLQRIASEIMARHAECLAGWNKYHGE